MPTYTYRCVTCGDTDRVFPMAEIPPRVRCGTCDAEASRRWTAVATLSGSSPVRSAVEHAARSAVEPAVVSSPPAAATSRPVTRNPLHAKLPRP